jgi:hypothetical protein
MIIKSAIRGGYRSAAEYMEEQGKNEKTRLVEMSDPSAKNLDDAFHNMWVVAANTKCKKPLHHISINPALGERLTDKQLMRIVEHCEEVFGYQMFHHQRVIVEHVKDGRQHFHVIWNRVSLMTGKAVWPGKDWEKAKKICREMEKELGLKSPTPRKGNKGGKHPRGKRMVSSKRVKTKSGFSNRVKHGHNVRRGRSHTSPHSIAGVLSMLNRVERHGRKCKTSKPMFYKSSFHQRHKNDGLTNDVGQGFNTRKAHQPHPVVLSRIILFSPASTPTPQPAFFQPERPQGGWPPAAVHDWKAWGRKKPRLFFMKWPELAP